MKPEFIFGGAKNYKVNYNKSSEYKEQGFYEKYFTLASWIYNILVFFYTINMDLYVIFKKVEGGMVTVDLAIAPSLDMIYIISSTKKSKFAILELFYMLIIYSSGHV